jgi:hypothetical protein
MKLDIIRYNDGPDGITALYADGSLMHKFPHNDAYLEGFIDGLQFAGEFVTENEHNVPADNCRSAWELGMVPKHWPNCSLRGGDAST